MGDNRIPEPPPGYFPFVWKTKPYERDKNVSVQMCPLCGNFGSMWQGGGYTDPGAEKFYQELLDANGGYCGYKLLCQKYEGVMLKNHWSRYGQGECTKCKSKYWHDFIGYPWHYYFNPETAEGDYDYTPTLF